MFYLAVFKSGHVSKPYTYLAQLESENIHRMGRVYHLLCADTIADLAPKFMASLSALDKEVVARARLIAHAADRYEARGALD
jgi:hypothetical protein